MADSEVMKKKQGESEPEGKLFPTEEHKAKRSQTKDKGVVSHQDQEEQSKSEAVKKQDQDQDGEAESEVSDDDTASEEEESEEEEEEEEDQLLQKLVGCKVNQSGKVLDAAGNVIGEVVSGNRKKAIGRRVKENGAIIDSKGNFIAAVAPVKPEAAQEEIFPSKEKKASGEETKISSKKRNEEEEEQAQIGEEGNENQEGPEGQEEEEEKAKEESPKQEEEAPKEEEQPPPEQGEQPLEEEEKAGATAPDLEKTTASLSDDAPTVDESGKIVNEAGEVLGELKKGIAHQLAGMSIDDEGNVVDEKGNIVGKAELAAPEKTEEENQAEAEEEKQAEAEEEKQRKITDQMSTFIDQALQRLKPITKIIKERIEAEEAKPEKERDEEGLANTIRPLIEESSSILGDTNGAIRGLDPTGDIIKNAQERSAERKASPEEYRLAELLSVLTEEVTKTIEDAKQKITSMPGAEAEQRKIADQMSTIIEQALQRIKPIIKIIKERIEAEERKPEQERDEERLANVVDPLIEESSNILSETNGAMRGLDPTGKVARTAQSKSADRKASPEEYRLAGLLSVLTEEVTKTIEDAKQKITTMPGAEAEQRKIADQMSAFIEQALHRIKPILKMITELIEAEERKPEKERDEERLVNAVRPLIEEGSNILGETYGAIRGLDPTGKVAKTAQARSAERKASPEEYRLAELLSILTEEVTKTIENAKKKIANMPHAEEELSPLWALLQNPLLQILAAVGLLLSGVLGLLGNILNGLGLGGLVNNLLGGLGLGKIVEGLGLGKLFGQKKKK